MIVTSVVSNYFESTIMPMIRKRHPEVLQEMSVMILGSVGMGIDDELSDLEAAIYLNESTWKRYGGQLQLSLNDCLFETNPWRKEGSVISVFPISWLLEGQSENFLACTNDVPWERVSFESLFTIQENLILYDPQETLNRLRVATAPIRRPEHLWKKSLLLTLQKLILEDFADLKSTVSRNRLAEAHILLGQVVEGLFHLGFLVFRQYYPWRKHLRWAFNKLPLQASIFGSGIDLVTSSENWNKKIEAVEALITSYKDFITDNALLPEIDIHSSDLDKELVWAERLRAWEMPIWRDWIDSCTKKAVDNGYSPYQFWVWSMWGWDK